MEVVQQKISMILRSSWIKVDMETRQHKLDTNLVYYNRVNTQPHTHVHTLNAALHTGTDLLSIL